MSVGWVTNWWITVALLIVGNQVTCSEYELLRFENVIKPDKVLDTSKLRITRVRRGAYAFTGSLQLLQDLGEDCKLTMKGYYSPNGKNAYRLLPYHLDPGSMCKFLNNDYKKYLQNLPNTSDFPKIKDKYFCPLKKGVYQIHAFEWNPDSLGPAFKPGFYKLELDFLMANGDRSQLNFYIKVTNV